MSASDLVNELHDMLQRYPVEDGGVVVERLVIRRCWAMPAADTFDIPAIRDWVKWRLARSRTSIDPFARNKRWATHTNDLNPNTSAEHHLDARAFLKMLIDKGVKADLIIFDPPYSPRQIQECYAAAGFTPTMQDTQSGRMKRECRELIAQLATPDAIALSFGWNTTGMGGDGWNKEEILICCHGGDHNDTLCVAERRAAKEAMLLATDNEGGKR